ncbi:MAG: glycoside hydrolase family 25 protein [Clostridia bacterium]|nr:glycoside hydrolase family 25 protein [Clostridia bacterium]
MKKTILFVLCVILCLSGCSFLQEPTTVPTTAQPEPVYVTDVNGRLVPAFKDVVFSSLSPTLFSVGENGRMQYADPAVETFTGIDVSVFQGNIDWEAVKADGIDFVMLRAGYRGYGEKGIMGEDDNFRKNCAAANAAGLHVGAYFFSQAISPEEAVEEAEFMLDVIDGCDLTYPIVFDLEEIDYDEARTDDLPANVASECAIAFCERIRETGREPMIYINCEQGYFRYDLPLLSGYQFWLAEYSELPSFVYEYKMWQYSTEGSVSGIEGNVDLNISVVDFSVKTETEPEMTAAPTNDAA